MPCVSMNEVFARRAQWGPDMLAAVQCNVVYVVIWLQTFRKQACAVHQHCLISSLREDVLIECMAPWHRILLCLVLLQVRVLFPASRDSSAPGSYRSATCKDGVCHGTSIAATAWNGPALRASIRVSASLST